VISEFDVIARYFQSRGPVRDDVPLGIGDDAALIQPPAGRQLVVAVDTLVAGRHFPERTPAVDIGYKALAVNLSDFAAMGATPAWATLSLTLPAADESWLQAFAEGFFSLANEYRVALVGGDTTRGPLAVTVQLQGYVEPGEALRRDAAEPGHALFVTGTLGDAACALHQLQTGAGVAPALLERLNRPQPRVALGQLLAGVAAAAIDISDGLLADLGHILEASGCGATIWPERLPTSATLQALPTEQRLDYQFNGGDDYELCFSVAPTQRAALHTLLQQQSVPVTEIGLFEAQTGLRCQYPDGRVIQPRVQGFDHFRQIDRE
jgi:thiamine-monophosphate kinase